MSDWIRSYSQCGEDILLWRVLKDVSKGFYIDIGAFDPNEHSVTRIFYDAGWSGINIEPNPAMLARFVKERPRDVNLGIAASDRVSEIVLNVVEGTGLTTLLGDIAVKHQKDGWRVEQIKVRANSLANIWDEYVPKEQQVHFLKIDVEGAEKAVITGADWSRHRPWILAVEAVEPLSNIENHQDWDPLLQEAGYVFVNFDGLNRYYVDAQRPELIEPLRAPLNFVTDRYVPAPVHEAQDQAAHLDALCNHFKAEFTSTKQALANTKQQLADTKQQLADAEHELSVLVDVFKDRPRPLWEALIFRGSGKPKKVVRRILFHKSGKPRGIFRNWILLPDRRPRAVFHRWMSSPEYQNMGNPIRLNGRGGYLIENDHQIIYLQELSPRASEIKQRLIEAIKKEQQQ